MNRHPTPDSIRFTAAVIIASAWTVTVFLSGMSEATRHMDRIFAVVLEE